MRHRPVAGPTLFALALTALCVSSGSAAEPETIVVSGFETPESVVHDSIADCYLVSNVGIGNPGALDRNGFISKVSPTGAILELDWIRHGARRVTLNGPKGLALHGDALYVADVDTLRIFDRITGAPGAAFPCRIRSHPGRCSSTTWRSTGTEMYT